MTEQGEAPAALWVLLSNSNAKELKQLADGVVRKMRPKLRNQLVAATPEKPILSMSVQLRSGRVAAVLVGGDVLATMFTGASEERRAAAGTMAQLAIRELQRAQRGVSRPKEPLPAANVSRERFTATRVRSVVHGGLPESSRKRH